MFTETNFDVTFPFSDKYNCNKIEHCIPLAKVIFLLFLFYLYFDVYMKILKMPINFHYYTFILMGYTQNKNDNH